MNVSTLPNPSERDDSDPSATRGDRSTDKYRDKERSDRSTGAREPQTGRVTDRAIKQPRRQW